MDCKDLRGNRVFKEFLGNLFRDLLVLKEPKEYKVFRVILVQDLKAYQELPVFREFKVFKVFKEILVILDHKV